MSDFIHNVPIKVPNKSGFDMDFENGFSGKCGQLIPVVCQEVLPNDTISLGVVSQVDLPPLVADAIGRIEFVFESFFVPSRLCWKGWSTFMTHPTAQPQYPEPYPAANRISMVPSFSFAFRAPLGTSADLVKQTFLPVLGPGSLADYLDFKVDLGEYSALYAEDPEAYELGRASVLPFIAYHLIWDNWYRDSRIQAPLFFEPSFYGNNNIQMHRVLSYLPSLGNIDLPPSLEMQPLDITYNTIPVFERSTTTLTDPLPLTQFTKFLDGSSVFDVRQRNWAKDYFTSASTQPQASLVGATVDFSVVDGQGSFSIAAVRASNSLQQWLERNNLAGYRYADQIYAQFGIYPADAIMDRPLYLGRHKQYVYNRSVFQQSPGITSNKNPFVGSLGAKAGSAQSVSDGSLIDSFTATEHGYIITLASLVPRAYYSQGRHRKFDRILIGDFPFPLLANMGDQMIRTSELYGFNYVDNSDFGYTDLYAEMKVNNDQIHGILRDGESLQHFALQRSFTPANGSFLEINSDFLTIPTDFLDQIFAVSTDRADCSYWANCYFKMKKISTLPVYSQPTLMDLQNGHVESIPRGGKRL